MKTLTLIFLSLATFLAAEPLAPKRPLGVPADAKPFNGRWYKVVLEKKTWHAARDKCKEMGGRLVCVPDAVTWEFLKTLTPASVWLGATDEVTTGAWIWVDGTPVGFSAWQSGQPDNFMGKQHCLAKSKRGDWDDHSRNDNDGPNGISGFICEWTK